MGMYFNVKKDENERCPYCDVLLVHDYQSKRSIGDMHDEWGSCCKRHPEPLPTLEKYEVENYYQSCVGCKKWIEYNFEPARSILVDEKDSSVI